MESKERSVRVDTATQPFTRLSLGQRVLLLRESNRLSLRTLADKVDLSASFLSQIERDETSPSIASLEKIASALGVDVSSLFLKSQPEPVLRVEDQHIDVVRDAKVQRLSLVNASMRPYRLSLEVGERLVALPNRSEVFLYVLRGVVTATYEEHGATLSVGDTFHLTLQTPLLTLENLGDEVAEVLSVNYL